MNLVYNLLTEPYIVQYGEFHHIIIENLLEFRKVMKNIENNEVIGIVDENNKYVKRCFINDFFKFDFNDRKILNKVHKDLLKISTKDDFYLEKLFINEKVRGFLAKLTYDYDFPLKYNDDVDMITLFKAYNISLDVEFDNYLNKVITIIQIYKDIFKYYFFVTYNIEQFLNQSELENLLSYLKYNQIALINFSRYNIQSDMSVHRLLIDSDLCRIL